MAACYPPPNTANVSHAGLERKGLYYLVIPHYLRLLRCYKNAKTWSQHFTSGQLGNLLMATTVMGKRALSTVCLEDVLTRAI